MLPAANRPILEHVLDALVDAGIDDIHVVVGYRGDRVRDHFGPTYRDRPLTYHTQKKQLGSGHALLRARDALKGDFLVVNGDEIVGSDTVRAVVDVHSPADTCTLAVAESDDAPLYGAVRLEDSTVTELIEKPGSGSYRLLNVGAYAFSPTFLATIDDVEREEGELALTDGISRVMERGGHVRGVRTDGMHSEVTYPWDLLELAATLLSVDASNGVEVSDSASVAEGAALYPPVVIGADAVVEPGAIVGPGTAVGRNATIEAGAVVRRSVVDTDTRVGMNATVVDSITGQSVQIGVGATAPGAPADVRIGNRVHEGVNLGCVLADRVRIGGGATVAPGVLVGPGADVGAGVTLRDNVDEDAEVRG